MAVPAVAGAAIAAIKSDFAKNIGDGLVSAFGGQTATDRERIGKANALLQSALAGDAAALATLTQQAFERRASDKKFSPKDVQDLARARLQTFYRTTGTQPPPQYAAALNIPVRDKQPTIAQQAFAPLATEIGRQAIDAAEERVQQRAVSVLPVVIIVAAVAAIYFLTRD